MEKQGDEQPVAPDRRAGTRVARMCRSLAGPRQRFGAHDSLNNRVIYGIVHSGVSCPLARVGI
jgi:hypothetical protein